MVNCEFVFASDLLSPEKGKGGPEPLPTSASSPPFVKRRERTRTKSWRPTPGAKPRANEFFCAVAVAEGSRLAADHVANHVVFVRRPLRTGPPVTLSAGESSDAARSATRLPARCRGSARRHETDSFCRYEGD